MVSKVDGQAKTNPNGEGQSKSERSKGNRKNHFYQNDRFKDRSDIPTLKYGPMNNFMEFKEALSKKALLEYGDLGKLIKHGKIILPEAPSRGAYDLMNDPDGLNKQDYLENMREHRRDLADLRRNKSKLYAMILQHLSDESLEAVQKELEWSAAEQRADPEVLWNLVERKHKVHSMNEIEAVEKLTARMQLATVRQGAYESIVVFKQRYTNALRAYKDHKNPEMTSQDEAMDFFSRLDNNRYAEFKTTYLNNLQLKACSPPKDLNEIFTLANTYLKPKAGTSGSYGSTFATTVDKINSRDDERRRRGGKVKDDDGSREQQKVKTKPEESRQSKRKKPLKCFNCGEEHYVNNCPELLQLRQACEDKAKKATAKWDASTFTTYQVNAIGTKGIGPNEVLLGNQVDISIMRPGILRNIEPTDKEIRVHGIGGAQLVVRNMGYLQGFFRVYSCEEAKVNVLSLAEVEDLYKVTYVKGKSFTVHLPDRDLVFERRDKLYVASFQDLLEEKDVYATHAYTKGDINLKRAH